MLNLEKPTFNCDVRGNHASLNLRSQWRTTIDSVIKITRKSDQQNVAVQLIASLLVHTKWTRGYRVAMC